MTGGVAGEGYGASHRNGAVPVLIALSPAAPAARPAPAPLWRVVTRRFGGPGSEPHAFWIPIVVIGGGLLALAIAWRADIVVKDRRLLYTAWTAPAVILVPAILVSRLPSLLRGSIEVRR